MKRIKYSVWDGVLVKNVDALPYHIDGNCIYQLPYSKKDRLASSRDGRPWKKAITSNTKELPNGTRKIAKCKGSYEWSSSEHVSQRIWEKTIPRILIPFLKIV